MINKGMSDIKDTKELISLIAVLAKAFKEASADGKIDALDLAVLIQIIPTIAPALEGASTIPEELKDLDAAEIAEITESVKEVVGQLVDEKYVDVAEQALKAGSAIFEIVKILKS